MIDRSDVASPEPTTVRPGIDVSRPFVFAALPTVVHLRQPGQIDRTRCGRRVRYYPRCGDRTEWRLCYECERSALAEGKEAV